MTRVFLTIDTELSVGSFRRGVDPQLNAKRSFWGGDVGYGIDWMSRRLADDGLKAVFFVDPIPEALYGPDLLKPVVDCILSHGHEVQLHIHAEWLPHLPSSPVGESRGVQMGDFSFDDQVRLLEFACAQMHRLGAPPMQAFRAGNFGANDDTLRALAKVGIRYDSSFNGAFADRQSRITLHPEQIDAVECEGVIEIPVSVVGDWPHGLRHMQVCAASNWEMRAGLDHAIARAAQTFTIVSHSFELISRSRTRANHRTISRFERLCDLLARRRSQAPTSGFIALDVAGAPPSQSIAPPNPVRTILRVAEQGIANLKYERS